MDQKYISLIGETLFAELSYYEDMYENDKDKPYWLYIHVVPAGISESGISKYYVGKSRNTASGRFGNNGYGYRYCPYLYKAIQKYGWDNMEHNILIKPCLDNDMANHYEKELIKYLKSNDYKYGYNLTSGGDGGCTIKTRNVDQYDIYWNYMQTFNSMTDAIHYLGVTLPHMEACVKEHKRTLKNYHFVFSDDDVQDEIAKFKGMFILQCDADNNIINTYPSAAYAEKVSDGKYKQKEIYRVINGEFISAYGFVWKYAKDYNLPYDKEKVRASINGERATIKFEIDGEYYSFQQLADKYGIPRDTIETRYSRGFSLKDMLSKHRLNHKQYTIMDISHTLPEWGRLFGIKSDRIHYYINRYNYCIEEALATIINKNQITGTDEFTQKCVNFLLSNYSTRLVEDG